MGGTTDPEQPEDDEFDDEDFPTPPVPPDGGWGWVVVFASMMCNFIVDGVCFTYGIFINEYTEYFDSTKGKTALIGALIPGMYLGIGPVSSALANKFGFRAVTITGSIISSAAFFLSQFSPNVDVLLVTYGILGGFGFGLMYLPSIVIVNFYFDKRRALATGIAVAGSGLGTIAFAPLGRMLLDMYDWKGCHMIISGVILHCCIFGALFRPLEQNKPRRRPAGSVHDDVPISGLMQLINEEKKRQRTISTGSLDGTLLTTDNKLIKDKRLIKKILMLQKLEEEEQVKRSATSLTVPGEVGNGSASQDENFRAASGSFRVTSGSFSDSGPASARNKMLERLRSESVPHNRRRRTISSNSEVIPVWQKRAGFTGSSRSLHSLKKEVSRPMYRKDIFYSGSVHSVAQYQSDSDVASYVASMMSIPELPEEDDNSWSARCVPLVSVLREMFDFSLFNSITFVLLCTCSILAMTGFFTPFVYITDNAIRLGYTPSEGAFLIAIMGIFNTLGRVVAGWVSDQPWADCLAVHNVALVVAGLATCLLPLLTSYWLLCVYSAVFGSGIACFISLRSIVLVELLGIENLTNSFGLLLLFQGIASLLGTPISGMIFDYTQSYTASFVTSGILVAISGIIVLPIRRVAAWERKREERTLHRDMAAAAAFAAAANKADVDVISEKDEEVEENPAEDTSIL